MIHRLPVAEFFAVPPPGQLGPVAYAVAPAWHAVGRGVFVALACTAGAALPDAVAAADESACRGLAVRVGPLLVRVAVDERSRA